IAMFQAGGARLVNLSDSWPARALPALVLRSIQSSLLYPLIDGIGDEVQIHRMHDHLHVDPVLYGEVDSVPGARDADLFFLQMNIFGLGFRDDQLLDLIVSR